MYDWRKMSAEERHAVLQDRKRAQRPWHSPPHWDLQAELRYLISAACYEHAPIIGASPQRMADCEAALLEACRSLSTAVYAWCVLPSHYHIVLQTRQIADLRREIGRFHGRWSYNWNGEDGQRGRHVWFNCCDRPLQSERHYWATINYVHHNPVRHGHVRRWQDWPYSSAAQYLESVGRERALEIWREHPILDYGKEWDV